MKNRNIITFITGILILLHAVSCSQHKDSDGRINFLVIMADDVSPELYGCYGNTEAATPFLDNLAGTGVMFTTCWAAPICSPSRAMVLTGRYAHRTGWYHNALRIPGEGGSTDFKKEHLTFARLLRDMGYATALSGKWQLPGRPDDPDSGFDDYCIWEPGENNLPEGSEFNGLLEAEGKLGRYWHPSLVSNGELLETKPDDFGPDICTDFLIRFMEKNRDNPFLAYYPMILPHGTVQGRTTTPLSGIAGDQANGTYREGVDYTDILLGRLLKALEENGLKENTLVIFTSDNAMPGKNCATNSGSRVPMVICCPGTVQKRGVSDELVSLSDILLTLVDFAGGDLPEGYQVDGISLKPYLTGETDAHREFLVNYLGTARLVRTRDWLLEAVDEVYGLPEGRLYDCRDGINDGKEVTGSQEADALRALEDLNHILTSYPAIDTNLQVVKQILPVYDGYIHRHRLE